MILRGCYGRGPYRAFHRAVQPAGRRGARRGRRTALALGGGVARRRLGQVAKLAGLRLTGDEVFVESGSNDTWFLSGETVLQVCYRGDADRLVRAAELLAVLPGGVPGPAVLDYGRDRLMSWMVVKRLHAGSLWDAWRSETSAVLRSYAEESP